MGEDKNNPDNPNPEESIENFFGDVPDEDEVSKMKDEWKKANEENEKKEISQKINEGKLSKPLTFEEAKKIVQDWIGPDLVIDEEEVIEKPYGWWFYYQSKEYLETGNELYQIFGLGGSVINKETGKICDFGSLYSTEESFKQYEAGKLREIDPRTEEKRY